MKRMIWFLLLLAATVSLGVFPSYAQGEDGCKKIEIAGTSSTSWEDAARVAAEVVSLPDLMIPMEVVYQGVNVENGQVTTFEVWLKLCYPLK